MPFVAVEVQAPEPQPATRTRAVESAVPILRAGRRKGSPYIADFPGAVQPARVVVQPGERALSNWNTGVGPVGVRLKAIGSPATG